MSASSRLTRSDKSSAGGDLEEEAECRSNGESSPTAEDSNAEEEEETECRSKGESSPTAADSSLSCGRPLHRLAAVESAGERLNRWRVVASVQLMFDALITTAF